VIKEIKSPCIGVCEYVKNTQENIERICRGCGRTAEEIEEWFFATERRKEEICRESEKRKDDQEKVRK
jgi:predicted Fe-S protein YdhL (DUF1289 family)